MREIDELMSLDPNKMTEEDLMAIIVFERKQRLAFDNGIKPKKEGGKTQSLENVLKALGAKTQATPQPSVVRRRV